MVIKIDIREFEETDKLIIIGEKGNVVIQHIFGLPVNRTDTDRYEGMECIEPNNPNCKCDLCEITRKREMGGSRG